MDPVLAAGMEETSARELFDTFRVSLRLAADGRLEVTFPDPDDTEWWQPAPDGYPLDGSRELLRFQGCYFVPLEGHHAKDV